MPAAASLEPATSTNPLILRFHDASDARVLVRLKELLASNPGQTEVIIELGGEMPQRIRLPFKIGLTPELLSQLKSLAGSEAIVV